MINIKAQQTLVKFNKQDAGTLRYLMRAEKYSQLAESKVITEAAVRSGIAKGALKGAWDAIGEVIKAWVTEGHTVADGLWSRYSQAHHRQVVVRLGAIAEVLYFRGEGLDDLLGGVEVGVAQDVENSLVAKLLLMRVLGFVQSVGVDEQCPALDGVDFFTLVFQVGTDADGHVGYHLQVVAVVFATAQNGRIMSGITEGEVARLEVDKSDEHGDKHGGGILVARECVVHAGADFVRHHLLCGEGAEQSCGLCHKE